MRVFAAVAALAVLIAAAPRHAAPIDSQIALERYELEMSSLKAPKAMIFTAAEDETPLRAPALVTAVVGLALVVITAAFFWPDLFARAPQFSTLLGS